jgi:uncharacterized membrane protein
MRRIEGELGAMDKVRFIHQIRVHLRDLPQEEIADIISDYEEHFRFGMQEGRTEEELAESLGNPDELAKEIRAVSLVKKAEDSTSTHDLLRAVVATIGLGLFNLIVVLVPFILLVVILLTIFLVGLSFVLGAPAALLYAPAGFGIHPVAAVAFVIGFMALGLLIIIGNYYLSRIFATMTVRYLKWNIAVIQGRA